MMYDSDVHTMVSVGLRDSKNQGSGFSYARLGHS